MRCHSIHCSFYEVRDTASIRQELPLHDDDTVESVARALGKKFLDITAPYAFGLYVAGFEGGIPQIWHVDLPVDVRSPEPRLSDDVCPVSPPAAVEQLRSWLQLQLESQPGRDPKSLGIAYVQKARELAPEDVGCAVKIVIVTAECARWWC